MRIASGFPAERLRTLLRSQAAQNVAEYGIGLAILGGGSAALAVLLRADIVFLWTRAARVLAKFAAIVAGG